MNIEYYDIKCKKQKNGLWGVPMSLRKMESLPLSVDCVLHSAIIIALAEIHQSNFIIQNQSEDSCLISFSKDVFKDKIVKNELPRH